MHARLHCRIPSILCVIAMAGFANQASAIAEHKLRVEEIAQLIRDKPVWCVNRSKDWRTCGAVFRSSLVSARQVEINQLMLSFSETHQTLKRVETMRYSIEPGGLCIDNDAMSRAPRRWYWAHDKSTALGAQEVQVGEALQQKQESIFQYFMRLSNETSGRRPNDRLCLGVSRIGEGDATYLLTPTFAAGTARAKTAEDEFRNFSAFSSDPDLNLGYK